MLCPSSQAEMHGAKALERPVVDLLGELSTPALDLVKRTRRRTQLQCVCSGAQEEGQ